MKQKENKSIFLECFGDTPQLRVLDFLIDNQFFDYPITEIARESNVSYNSLKIFLDKFIESGILIKTRKLGKSYYYKLNIENPFIKNLIKLDWMLVKSNLGLSEEPKKIAKISA
jgi:predicted transcriptional regulator